MKKRAKKTSAIDQAWDAARAALKSAEEANAANVRAEAAAQRAETAAHYCPAIPLRNGWRPFETAPRDGSWVLVSAGDRVGVPVAMAQFRLFFGPEQGHYGYAIYGTDPSQEYMDVKYWQPIPEAIE